jgi:hypothetical protein
MGALVHLNQSFNNFEGMILQTSENLHNLHALDLSNNSISGEVLDYKLQVIFGLLYNTKIKTIYIYIYIYIYMMSNVRNY